MQQMRKQNMFLSALLFSLSSSFLLRFSNLISPHLSSLINISLSPLYKPIVIAVLHARVQTHNEETSTRFDQWVSVAACVPCPLILKAEEKWKFDFYYFQSLRFFPLLHHDSSGHTEFYGRANSIAQTLYNIHCIL